MSEQSRRKFIKHIGSTAALLGIGQLAALAKEKEHVEILQPEKRIAPNDKIRIACVGMGIMGFGDVETAIKVPGVEFVGAADLYTGHLTKVKDVFGPQVYTTRDYRELLKRKDIDAIIVATPDHWHDTIAIAAMEAGKAVYCEKPMVQQIEEGHKVIAAQQRTKAVFQVGSQRVSSVALAEARKRYQAGEIGQLNVVEARMDRHSALGAWQYSIPPDASPATVDFDTFLKDTAKMPFDLVRFFRWRNYRAYGTGIPGDLFVHLISGLHFITGSLGPTSIYASGNLVQWKDGRDVPDVVVAIFDYPETKEHPAFQMTLRVNFADGSGGGEYTRFIGTDGVLELGWNDFKIKKHKLPEAPGYGGWDTYNTFTKQQQAQYVQEYNAKYPTDKRNTVETSSAFASPKGYDDRLDHFTNFFESMRSGKPVVEDAVFGLRAAGPALVTNESYFSKKLINWDPVNMKIV
ncbi:Tat (twin-arginine translocation) pathway signal sequence [Chitinophaga ginsengisegetis]|uniref:Tat (Twin-arginine translocation) pathway signal sequence n=1 Tax=Chitinophaga ginsengisegetis TaxID=393003 RepID=A0A1T5NZE4_9BACT|nr:Gfo/Idh/MocA family oxidoreductase [Chitinophaga ginsengisegetis]SKD05663.1 Tat (twin-arginine translocation) pathway signal sequence [Chitinophaga ginsengisegetis]